MTPNDPKEWKRSLVDCILSAMAHINCNIGKDSTVEEKDTAKLELIKLENMIKEIDPDYFKKIEQDNDENS